MDEDVMWVLNGILLHISQDGQGSKLKFQLQVGLSVMCLLIVLYVLVNVPVTYLPWVLRDGCFLFPGENRIYAVHGRFKCRTGPAQEHGEPSLSG